MELKKIEAKQGLCCIGFRRGDDQIYKNIPNINPLNKHLIPIYGEGVNLKLK